MSFCKYHLRQEKYVDVQTPFPCSRHVSPLLSDTDFSSFNVVPEDRQILAHHTGPRLKPFRKSCAGGVGVRSRTLQSQDRGSKRRDHRRQKAAETCPTENLQQKPHMLFFMMKVETPSSASSHVALRAEDLRLVAPLQCSTLFLLSQNPQAGRGAIFRNRPCLRGTARVLFSTTLISWPTESGLRGRKGVNATPEPPQ